MRSRPALLFVALVGVISVALLIPSGGASALAQPTRVVVSKADEIHGTGGWNRAGSVQYVAFTRKDPSTDRLNAFLRKIRRNGSFTTVKLNATGEGDVGGVFFRSRIVYSQTHRGNWDLEFFNIETGNRSTPAGVNTGKYEVNPTRSGPYLLFNRDDPEGPTTRVVLQNLKTATRTVLARSTSLDDWVYAGQVSGNWAVWTECAPVCDAYRGDIASGTTTKLPKPAVDPSFDQYDASVEADGTVYVVRSGGDACDSTVQFVRFGPADPAFGSVVAELSSGKFTTFTYARPNPDDDVDLFFARGSCTTFRSDIFKITVEAP